MFRVQVWDDDANRYVDVVLSFDQWGAVGFRHAQPGDTPAEYDDSGKAWRDAVDLQGRFGDAIVTLLDTSTGERHFDERNLPEVDADAIEAPAAPEIWTDDWIIQRAVRIRVASAGGDVYEPWPGYTHPMTRDQAVKALEECEARWPEHEFRAHRLRLEEKVAADAIDRARRSVQSRKYD
ncbi:hypothetical protein [Paraburkholderia haematera]|uniref:DUF4376 domain-containing protein n=1 Tax=Paraburkholderia haematera TaxID=2793077 RepID=A0ABM8SR57_9BURK|nr:hypothetical protein [Paraburkholderia haematera]CAE6826999.1 hypothetical protein R69888_06386 [Paraburkholderia haematera]